MTTYDDFDADLATVIFEHDDDTVVVVIGSGPGGATVANELCQKGINVVMFEAGKRYKLSDFENDPLYMEDLWSWKDRRTTSGNHPLVSDWPDSPGVQVKAVGGCSVHWVGNAPRIHPHEFKALSTYGPIAGANLMDWPIDYEEMEPFYVPAEDRLGVSGSAGIPEMRPTNSTKMLRTAAKRFGYTRYNNGRVAVNQFPRDGRNGCDEIGFCMSGCKSGAKWSTLYTEIPRAEETGRLELRTEAMVLKVEHNDVGRVSGVVYADKDGAHHRQKARLVCIAGNSIETPRLLLNSESARFPDGLANSSGAVGKHHMMHVNAQVFGIFEQPVNFHRGRVGAGSIEDETVFDPSRGFAGGYYFHAMGGIALPGLAAILAPGGWGRGVAALVEDYTHMGGMFVLGEDLPQENNRITLHPTEKDHYGLPIPHINIDEHANDIAMKNHAYKQGRALLSTLGAKTILDAPMLPSSHNMGTSRMADNPRDGVVNRWGQSHDLANLFISDGSQFTTSGAANPTLTIVALAIRQAKYIAEAMRGNEL